MATEYFFKRDFWTGFYKLTERSKISPGQGIVGYLFLFGIVLLLIGIGLMSLPFWILIISFGVERKYRMWGGFAVFFGLIYFFLDLSNKWLSPYFFFGYLDENQVFNHGLFRIRGLSFFVMINICSSVLALYFIVDSYLFKSQRKNFQEISNVLLITICVIGFLISTKVTESYVKNVNEEIYNKELQIINTPQKESVAIDIITEQNSNFVEAADSEPKASTAYYGMIENYRNFGKEKIKSYFDDIASNQLNAEEYFADNVLRYLTLKNLTPDEINKVFVKDTKEFTNQEFVYDLDTVKFEDEINGIGYFTFWAEFKCFRKSKNKIQSSTVLIKYGIDEEGKIASIHFPTVKYTRFL